MEEENLKEIANNYYKALNDKDIECLAGIFKPNSSVDYPSEDIVHGLPAIREFFKRAAQNVPQLHVITKEMFACKNRVTVYWFSNGIKSVTQTIDEHYGIDTFEIENGLIKKLTVTYSLNEMKAAMPSV